MVGLIQILAWQRLQLRLWAWLQQWQLHSQLCSCLRIVEIFLKIRKTFVVQLISSIFAPAFGDSKVFIQKITSQNRYAMYAIVEIAGHQFKVEKDQKVFVNRLQTEEGKKVAFDNVLLVADGDNVTVGAPAIDGAH
eukprot:TRINITY_DN184760_c0_g1_i1.p2 TRINITY_DN184760_c0_g1~~TRINITY_DN184760_c0_g1_i1.p2  ORF type:complete len:136 (-),score=6.85 TRINITY_DN184760_c0_g1_i1:95-502(-)